MTTKFDKSFEFRFLGHAPNFNSFKSKVLSLSDEDWNEFTFRQKNIVGHADTLTVPLVFDHIKKTRPITHKHHGLFVDYLQELSHFLAAIGEPSNIKRANIVLLKANSFIKRHQDRGDFLERTRRIHIPVVTNSGCYLTVEDSSQHFAEGEMWEIDNTGKYHSAHNEGKTDRIHLIIDIG